jgi:hypothetical protein
MAQVYVFEVWDEKDEDCVTRVRVLSDNTLEVETITAFSSDRIVLTPKQAREFARDLNAAVKVASN